MWLICVCVCAFLLWLGLLGMIRVRTKGQGMHYDYESEVTTIKVQGLCVRVFVCVIGCAFNLSISLALKQIALAGCGQLSWDISKPQVPHPPPNTHMQNYSLAILSNPPGQLTSQQIIYHVVMALMISPLSSSLHLKGLPYILNHWPATAAPKHMGVPICVRRSKTAFRILPNLG